MSLFVAVIIVYRKSALKFKYYNLFLVHFFADLYSTHGLCMHQRKMCFQLNVVAFDSETEKLVNSQVSHFTKQ